MKWQPSFRARKGFWYAVCWRLNSPPFPSSLLASFVLLWGWLPGKLGSTDAIVLRWDSVSLWDKGQESLGMHTMETQGEADTGGQPPARRYPSLTPPREWDSVRIWLDLWLPELSGINCHFWLPSCGTNILSDIFKPWMTRAVTCFQIWKSLHLF